MPAAPPPARSRPCAGACRRRVRGGAARDPVPALPEAPRSARAPAAGPSAHSPRTCESGRPSRRRSFVLRSLFRLLDTLRGGLGLAGLGRRRLFLLRSRSTDRHGCLGRDLLAGLLAGGELAVGRDAAVAGAGQGRVRAALAGGEDGRATARELLLGAAEGGLCLRARELGVRGDVDLPAREPRGQAGVQALLAYGERQLIVGDDDRRLLRLVVDEHLADAGRRERLGDETSRLRIPGNDVDLLAAQLGDHHADAGTPRAYAGPDGVDSLDVRLDRDLGAVAGLPGDASDLDEPVGDLGHFELEERLDELRISP